MLTGKFQNSKEFLSVNWVHCFHVREKRKENKAYLVLLGPVNKIKIAQHVFYIVGICIVFMLFFAEHSIQSMKLCDATRNLRKSRDRAP